MKRLVVVSVFALVGGSLSACKRNTPVALSLAISETGGCAELKPNPKFGKFICWGPGVAATRTFPKGDPSKVIGGYGKKLCGIFEGQKLACWEGNAEPVDTGISGEGLKVALGKNHFCAASRGTEDHFQCQGSNEHEQLGVESDWTKYPIKLVAVGDAFTCVGYEEVAGVLCRGRGMPKEPLLVGSELRDLRAGANHVCAVTKQGRTYCWGKNEAGQLGDGTTNDAPMPITVPGLDAAASIALGARHTCAVLGNRTVHCWGANDKHQLANGTTAPGAHPAMVLGALGVWEIAAVNDGTCVRLGQDGEVRCWGPNEHGQLGDPSNAEHTVPAPVKFH